MLCCKGCVFDFGWKPGDTSVPDECIGCMVINGKPTKFKPKPMTNADCIRAMTDEELAVFLADEIPHGDCYGCDLLCATFDGDQFTDCCQNAFHRWLQQPAEGDA